MDIRWVGILCSAVACVLAGFFWAKWHYSRRPLSGQVTELGLTKISNEKDRVEIMLTLHKTAWLNFDRRRAYEWKLSLGVWAVIVAFMALCLGKDLNRKLLLEVWVYCLCGAIAILLIQFWFLRRVNLGNGCDQVRAHFYESEINKSIGISFGESTGVDRVSDAIWKTKGPGRLGGWWSVVFRFLVTLTLLSIAGAIMCACPRETTTDAPNLAYPVCGKIANKDAALCPCNGRPACLCCRTLLSPEETRSSTSKAAISSVAMPAPASIPVNAQCPITGDPVSRIAPVRAFDGKTVGFCCNNCMDLWDTLDEADRKAKLEAPIERPRKRRPTHHSPDPRWR